MTSWDFLEKHWEGIIVVQWPIYAIVLAVLFKIGVPQYVIEEIKLLVKWMSSKISKKDKRNLEECSKQVYEEYKVLPHKIQSDPMDGPNWYIYQSPNLAQVTHILNKNKFYWVDGPTKEELEKFHIRERADRCNFDIQLSPYEFMPENDQIMVVGVAPGVERGPDITVCDEAGKELHKEPTWRQEKFCYGLYQFRYAGKPTLDELIKLEQLRKLQDA
ncbi:hypothetical protein FACS189491_12260 [Spirochaetia bacterium]|nr:hypothetical protein FACS189491_12260 [Spirochaetia bacterium]